MATTRTQITTTDDTDTPRVIHLGDEVIWYAYARIDRGLYLQREQNGVRGPETLIAVPVDKIDMVVDPDGLRAWIYFTTDGALRAIEVDTLTETPTVQAFQRGQGWYERVDSGRLGGAGFESLPGFTDLDTAAFRGDDTDGEVYPPRLALLSTSMPGQQVLAIDAMQINRGQIAKFRVYRCADVAGSGWQFWSDVAYAPPALGSSLLVPMPVSPTVYLWAAVTVRGVPLYRVSAWSNVVTSDDLGDAVLGHLGGGTFDGDWALVDKTPIKYAAPPDNAVLGRLGGGTFDGDWALVDKTPIKYAAPPDNAVLGRLGGGTFDVSWALDGFDPIAP